MGSSIDLVAFFFYNNGQMPDNLDEIKKLEREKNVYQLLKILADRATDAYTRGFVKESLVRIGKFDVGTLLDQLAAADEPKLKKTLKDILTRVGDPTINYLTPLYEDWDKRMMLISDDDSHAFQVIKSLPYAKIFSDLANVVREIGTPDALRMATFFEKFK